MYKRTVEKAKSRVSILKLRNRRDGAWVGFLLVLLFCGRLLMQCGDVEPHPGPRTPTKASNYRQTRLTSASRAGSVDSVASSGEPSDPKTVSKELSFVDIMAKLQEMDVSSKGIDKKLDGVASDVKTLTGQFDSLKREVRDLRDEVQDLRLQNHDLKRMNSDLCDRVEKLENKTDDLEGRSKRNNLLFFGVTRAENETNDLCEQMLKDLTEKKMGVSGIEFDRVHRLNAKPDSPIIARC